MISEGVERPPGSIERVELTFGERGKPALAARQNSASEPLHFNLSDSEDLAVYAFSLGSEMGVDVEILRPMPDALNIARSFFAAEEREVLSSVPASGVPQAFFNCWTRKEAYIKAIGEGLSEPLDRFCVTLAPAEPARFLHIGGSSREAEAWSLMHFEPAPDAVGALAFRHHDWQISCRTLAHRGGAPDA